MAEDEAQLEQEIESKEASLDALCVQIDREIEDKVNSTFDHSGYTYLTFFRSHLESDHPIRKEYKDSTIHFNLGNIADLGTDEFNSLLVKFEDATKLAYLKAGRNILKNVLERINPSSDVNVIRREWEHSKNIPSDIRNKGTIDITWFNDGDMTGQANYDLDLVDDKTLALAGSEPSSLSEMDVVQALEFAKRTGDEQFVKEVQTRIDTRKHH